MAKIKKASEEEGFEEYKVKVQEQRYKAIFQGPPYQPIFS